MVETNPNPVPASRLIAHLGHEGHTTNGPTYKSVYESDRDENMVGIKLDGVLNHTDILEIHDMGWYVDGITSHGLTFFHKA